MDDAILAAIQTGSTEEIIKLFSLRAEAQERCAKLSQETSLNPDLRAKLRTAQKTLRTIDNYMKAKLEPICKIDETFIFGFADQCQTFNQFGFAPGNLDRTDSGQQFINPALGGYMAWGVFEPNTVPLEIMPPVTIRHFDVQNANALKTILGQ